MEHRSRAQARSVHGPSRGENVPDALTVLPPFDASPAEVRALQFQRQRVIAPRETAPGLLVSSLSPRLPSDLANRRRWVSRVDHAAEGKRWGRGGNGGIPRESAMVVRSSCQRVPGGPEQLGNSSFELQLDRMAAMVQWMGPRCRSPEWPIHAPATAGF